MTDALDIPDSAFQIKADYFERPTVLVPVIKDFIGRFGTPHLWPGHTHTKPPKGSRVTFLAKYSLPKSHRRPERWAPCPCCSPRHPKYYKQGLIAWFSEEGVIRCVGDKCYKTLDPEGYEIAIKQLNTEIEAERRSDFLLTRIPRIAEYASIIEGNLPAVAAIDDMLNRFSYVIDRTFAFDLWPEVSTGLLRYTVTRREVRRAADGEEEVHTFRDFENYGTIDGFKALRPGSWRFAKKLQMRMENLRAIDFGTESPARIATMTEAEKQKAIKILSFAHREASRLLREAEEVRRFFAPVTIATVNGWSAQESAPIRIHLALDHDGLHVARDASQHHTLIRWPEHFWRQLTPLEPLTREKAA
jgi:hypothetical protein